MSELIRESVTDKVDMDGLAQAYVRGEIDIPEIARLLGDGWDEARVAADFESMGIYRPLANLPMLDSSLRSILSRIPNLQNGSINAEFDSDNLIMREVIASQRIEGIHAQTRIAA